MKEIEAAVRRNTAEIAALHNKINILSECVSRSSEAREFAPGSHGCHEALHMAMVMAELVDERICQHPAIMAKSEWEDLAQKACEGLHDLYQGIGREHMK